MAVQAFSIEPVARPWGMGLPTWPQSLLIRAMHARLLRGVLRKAARRAVLSEGVDYDIELAGVRLRCRLGDNQTERSILEQGIQARRLGLVQVIGCLNSGDVFVDAGANCGVFTAFAAKKIEPSGRVIAIEPIPAMVSRLRFNVAANGFTNVSVFEAALSDAIGTATLNVVACNQGASSLANSPARDSRLLRVRTTTLADVVEAAGVDRIDAMKIDVEGFEDRALLPYVASMPRAKWPKRIFIELIQSRRWRVDCIAALIDEGYVQTWSDGHDILLELPPAFSP